MSLLLRIVALVLFILAVVLTWVSGVSEATIIALISAGLACWVGSSLVGGVSIRA